MQRYRLLASLVAVTLALSLPPSLVSPAHSQAGIAATGLSLRQVIEGMEDLVKTIEQSASRLIEQGNNALAQQQMIASGILKSTINQIRIAYKDSLDQTFDKIATTQTNISSDLDNLISQFKDIKDKAVVDINNVVYSAQSAANQVIDRLPFTKKEPVIYGMIVRDVFSELPKVPYDIEILGFNFINPSLNNKMPKFSVDGQYVPETNISIQQDRAHIVLPDSIKSKIGYADNFCAPRPRFAIHSEVFYSTTKGPFWPFRWSSEDTLRTTLFGLANAELFRSSITYSADRTSTSDRPQSFRVRSQWTGVGCEASNSGNLSYTVPDNATQINCTAAWVDQAGLKSQTAACARGGATITANGTITGRDRNCFVSDILSFGLFRRVVGRRTVCDCPGGGHATFELSGTYLVPETKVESLSHQVAGNFRFDDRVDGIIPGGDGTKIKKIDVEIKRDRCDSIFDRINISMPSDKNLIIDHNSDNGHFFMQVRSEKYSITRKN